MKAKGRKCNLTDEKQAEMRNVCLNCKAPPQACSDPRWYNCKYFKLYKKPSGHLEIPQTMYLSQSGIKEPDGYFARDEFAELRIKADKCFQKMKLRL